MSDIPTLTTDRFVIRPVQPGDEEALFAAFSDPDLMRYWSRGPFADLASLREYIFDRNWGGRTWVAVPRAGGDPVMRLVASSPQEQVAEIGYIVMPGHGRQGIARECLSALLTHLFREEGFHRVFADVDPRNTGSNRLLEALGFTLEGRLRHTMKTHIGWCDTALWGMLEDEWQY